MVTNGAGSTVSVVVLSYDRPALLREALDSIAAQSHTPFEIILVDNHSPSSEEVARVAAGRARVRLVQNPRNLGFAAGMNRGIAEAAGEYVYLTEDDIVLDRDCIRHLVEYGKGAPGFGLLSPVMYNKALGTIRFAGAEVTLGGVYRKKVHGEGETDRGQFREPFDVTNVDGAVIFARTKFLKRLGGFREEFFMYVEAVELCARVSKAGGRMTLVPQAKVYHFEPPPGANTSAEFAFHRLKNFFSLYLLHARARHLPEFFCRYALLGLPRAAGNGSLRPFLRALFWTARRAPSLLRERLSFNDE
ncbi:MAG: glycosyltransferase family 2 protein [Pyrinomonadaceae bacterium]